MSKSTVIAVTDAPEVSNAAPVQLSSMNTAMTLIPRFVEDAVQRGHKALENLATSAKAYAKTSGELTQGTVESLLTMLDDIGACLEARRDGAKTLKNSEIDNVLKQNGVKAPRFQRNKDTKAPEIGNRSGASRYIAVATFEHKGLWPAKKEQALAMIAKSGLEFGRGLKFSSPYDALRGGVAFSPVHDVWAAAVRNVIAGLNPTAKLSKFERTTKTAVSLTMAERVALIAQLNATIPASTPVVVENPQQG